MLRDKGEDTHEDTSTHDVVGPILIHFFVFGDRMLEML